MSKAYPINVLPRIKQISEVVNIYCVTANPVEVIITKTKNGAGILGVIDGGSPLGLESEKERGKKRIFEKNRLQTLIFDEYF